MRSSLILQLCKVFMMESMLANWTSTVFRIKSSLRCKEMKIDQLATNGLSRVTVAIDLSWSKMSMLNKVQVTETRIVFMEVDQEEEFSDSELLKNQKSMNGRKVHLALLRSLTRGHGWMSLTILMM